nr:hypothetical protein [Desulfonatronum lacustre]
MSRNKKVNAENALPESRKNLLFKPASQKLALSGVSALDQLDADFNFENGNCGNEQAMSWLTCSPRKNAKVRFAGLGFSQFGDNIRVEEKHQEKSAG